jgi:hypothetical protein
MAFYLAFWSARTTATVVRASTSASARTRANARHRSGYGRLVGVQKANDQDARLIQCLRKCRKFWKFNCSLPTVPPWLPRASAARSRRKGGAQQAAFAQPLPSPAPGGHEAQ